MSIFATPDWEPNVIGDKSSKDLFNLGTLKKKRLKRQTKNEKFKEKFAKEKSSKTKKVDRKHKQKNTVTSNVIKQERLPLIRPETEDKQKRKLNRKKKLEDTRTLQLNPSRTNKQHLKESGGKKTKQKHIKLKNNFEQSSTNNSKGNSRLNKFKEKFRKLQAKSGPALFAPYKSKDLSLRQRMMNRLKASRFRFLNESMYTSTGKEAEDYFQKDPDSFKAYHDGFKQQVSCWPLNPLDIIITSIKKLPQSYVIADFGCGDAQLAQSVKCTVHSFDLIAINEHVTACNMANVPLENGSVDVAVFCLSLMGTNLKDYIIEANRVLKMGGVLKIVEVESRFENIETFIKDVQHFGFTKTLKDLSHDLFYFIDFKKSANCKQKQKLVDISLNPCLYKKR